MKVKNIILLYAVGMIVGLFTTFVLTVFWEWFVVPAFHVPAVSFWVMYGLTLMISLFQSQGDDFQNEHRHKIVAVMLDACVPADRREEVNEELAGFGERVWFDAGWKILGKVTANTVALCLGFVIHILAS